MSEPTNAIDHPIMEQHEASPEEVEAFIHEHLVPSLINELGQRQPDLVKNFTLEKDPDSVRICDSSWGKGLAQKIEAGELSEEGVLKSIESLTALSQLMQEVKMEKLPPAVQKFLKEKGQGRRITEKGDLGTYRLWTKEGKKEGKMKWGQEPEKSRAIELLGQDNWQGLQELLAAAEKSGQYGQPKNPAIYFNLGESLAMSPDGKLEIGKSATKNMKVLDIPSVAGSMGFALSNLQERPGLQEKARQQVLEQSGVDEFQLNMELLGFRLPGDMWKAEFEDKDPVAAKRHADTMKSLIASRHEWAKDYL